MTISVTLPGFASLDACKAWVAARVESDCNAKAASYVPAAQQFTHNQRYLHAKAYVVDGYLFDDIATAPYKYLNAAAIGRYGATPTEPQVAEIADEIVDAGDYIYGTALIEIEKQRQRIDDVMTRVDQGSVIALGQEILYQLGLIA